MPLRLASLPSTLSRFGRVCIALGAATPEELLGLAEGEQGSFFEFRFDLLRQPDEGAAVLGAFLRQYPEAQVLATCRRQEGGGGFAGSPEEQLALLLRFAGCGAALVDLELETLTAVSPERLRRFGQELARTSTVLVVSAHDFNGTGDLPGTLARLRSLGAAAGASIYKVVATAQSLADNLLMLRFVEAASREVPIVGMCMGVQGLPSRVLGPRAGSAWTFAAAARGEATAPGQVSASALLGMYRATRIGPDTRLYGVAGNPVAHSLSPAMHNAAFRAADVDAVYLPLHTTSLDDLL